MEGKCSLYDDKFTRWFYRLIQLIRPTAIPFIYFTLIIRKLFVLTESQLNKLVEQSSEFTDFTDIK